MIGNQLTPSAWHRRSDFGRGGIHGRRLYPPRTDPIQHFGGKGSEKMNVEHGEPSRGLGETGALNTLDGLTAQPAGAAVAELGGFC